MLRCALVACDAVVTGNIHDFCGSFWGTDIVRQCVTRLTEKLPGLKGRHLERGMGGAIVD